LTRFITDQPKSETCRLQRSFHRRWDNRAIATRHDTPTQPGPDRRRAPGLDAHDPLAVCHARFEPLPDGLICLDRNSLGRHRS
jgi:hypothetical protein